MTETMRQEGKRQTTLSEEEHRKLLSLGSRASSSRVDTEQARGELHAELRRLHKAGRSIRNLAIAAGLSSTRVGVIVNGGGSK